MNHDPTLCRSFVRQAKDALARDPHVRHEWSIDEDEDHCILDIPEQCDGGFAITTEVHPDRIVVMADGAHASLDLDAGGDADDVAARALGLVRDLLSPAMRVRERLSGDRPYRWGIESCHDGRWVTEEQVGMIFFNYFGKRTERIYQNTVLPARAPLCGPPEA